MSNFLFLVLGAWLGYELKRILDQPFDIPETTRQYLANVEPKCKLCIYCDEPPLPGRYFCSEHVYHEKQNA
jgi:hypothetical protein